MSRENVLVTAEWAEENLGTAGVVFVEVDEDTTAYGGGHQIGRASCRERVCHNV